MGTAWGWSYVLFTEEQAKVIKKEKERKLETVKIGI